MDWPSLAILPWVVSLGGVAALPAFRLARALRRMAGAKRNAMVRCARCNEVFPGLDEVHLFEGRYVCGACAAAMQRRMAMLSKLTAFGGTAALVIGVGAMVVDLAWSGGTSWWTWNRIAVVFAPPAMIVLGAHRTMRRLRSQNALEQLSSTPGGELDASWMPAGATGAARITR